MARLRTVISPPAPPRASRAKAPTPETKAAWAPRPGQPLWRVRFTADTNPKTASTYFQDRDDAETARDAKPGTVLETLTAGLWGPILRDVPTVQQLAEQGMAREVQVGSSTRWEISPLGQEILTDAMVGRDE